MRSLLFIILYSIVSVANVLPNTLRLDILAELHGDVECRFLGAAVAPAGDVNGDGYSDVLVSAPRNSDGTCPDLRGEVYLYYGGDPFDIEPDLIFSRGSLNMQFGLALAANADLNDDQFNDIVISDNSNIYIFLGSAELDTIPDFIIPQEETIYPVDNGFGRCLDISGDFNGDGYNDLITSAPSYTNLELLSGKVYVFFGGPDFDDIPDWTEVPDTESVRLGTDIAIGNVNGDEYDDLVLFGIGGLYGESNYFSIYYGNYEPDTLCDVMVNLWQFTEPNSARNLISLELNQDEFDDIIVDSKDSMFVYFGSEEFDLNHDGVLYHIENDGYAHIQSKTALSVIGDINNDGIMDIGAGCSGYPWPSNLGVMEIFLGNENLYNFPDEVYAPFMREKYGYALAAAGDVNGDGIADFIEGEPYYLEFNGQYPRESGRVHIFSGDTTLVLSIHDEVTNIEQRSLGQNYPNPFNDSTSIPYNIPHHGIIEITIYTLDGKEIQKTQKHHPAGGDYVEYWNGKNSEGDQMPSGMYFYELYFNNEPYKTKNMILLK